MLLYQDLQPGMVVAVPYPLDNDIYRGIITNVKANGKVEVGPVAHEAKFIDSSPW